MEQPTHPQSFSPAPSPKAGRRVGLRRLIGPKRLMILGFLAAIVACAWYLRKQGVLDPTVIQSLINVHPMLSIAVFILIYSLLVLSALPSIPANLAAGLFWGPVLGGILSTTGATLGAVAAFAAARSIFGRPLAKHFDNRIITEMQQEFEAKGWLFLAFVRVNPVFPTGILNYVLGLTAIDAFTYVWVTFAFILPPSIAVALIGHSIGTFVVQGEISDSLKLMLTISAAITALTAFGYSVSVLNRVKSGNKMDSRQ